MLDTLQGGPGSSGPLARLENPEWGSFWAPLSESQWAPLGAGGWAFFFLSSGSIWGVHKNIENADISQWIVSTCMWFLRHML